MANIKSFPSGPFATNAYVLSSEGQAAIIDPAPGSAHSIEAYVAQRGVQVGKILLTHSHWDHIADCALLKAEYQVPVWVHPLDARNLAEPGSDGLPLMAPIEGVEADYFLKDGEILEVGATKLEVWHTPGHSPGAVCFYCADEGVLFSGDLLFQGSIGNLSLPTAQPDLMWPSLKRVAALPPETVVFPGHGEATTIGQEPWLPQAKELFWR